MVKVFVLLFMFWMHVQADFRQQGIMASMKQKNWWWSQPGFKMGMNQKDYIPPLIWHSFDWAVMIHIPVILYSLFTRVGSTGFWIYLLVSIAVHTAVHVYIDDAKANCGKINLIEDQLCHIAQIVAVWLTLFLPVTTIIVP